MSRHYGNSKRPMRSRDVLDRERDDLHGLPDWQGVPVYKLGPDGDVCSGHVFRRRAGGVRDLPTRDGVPERQRGDGDRVCAREVQWRGTGCVRELPRGVRMPRQVQHLQDEMSAGGVLRGRRRVVCGLRAGEGVRSDRRSRNGLRRRVLQFG